MRRRDLDRIDPSFTDDLAESVNFVWLAAQWLSKKFGFKVLIPPTLVRPNAEQRSEYSDEGDLEIVKRIEVKHRRSIDFTNTEDFPFDTVIVDVDFAWDKAHPKPEAYIIFDKDGSHCAIVRSKTSPHWVKRARQVGGRTRDYYECSVEYVEFWEVKLK